MTDISLNDIYHRLGGIEAGIATLKDENARAADKRSEMYRAMEGMRGDLHSVKDDIDRLDARVSRIEPGFDDYQKLRHQVDGAGKLGRGLWWIGGWLIAGASSLVAGIHWLTGWPKLPS